MDYQALLYGPIYDTGLGVVAQLTVSDSSGPVDVTVIDKTIGVDIGDTIQEQVIVPAAIVRAKELADKSVTVAQLIKATITFNGRSWMIESYRMLPSPLGEADGEVFLLLEEVA